MLSQHRPNVESSIFVPPNGRSIDLTRHVLLCLVADLRKEGQSALEGSTLILCSTLSSLRKRARKQARKCGGRFDAHEISRPLKNGLVPRLKFSADPFPRTPFLSFSFPFYYCVAFELFDVYSMKRKRGRIVEEYDSRYNIFQPRTKNRWRNKFEF